jgi:hypothetical protein
MKFWVSRDFDGGVVLRLRLILCLFLGKRMEWDAGTCRGERQNGVGCGMLGPAEEISDL